MTDSVQTKFVVNDAFEHVQTIGQGIDRCKPPAVEQLADWWDESPYSVVNIYLGGVHYPLSCRDENQNAFWVHAVAEQGWTFTAIWVGPQPPCTNFTHRMSNNPGTAYLEGRAEAAAAALRARELGLFGDITIHYDVEGYFGSTTCRNVVKSFVQGWTDALHELDYGAGAYGGGCSSSVTDWSENSPAIDQVWIAHWQLNPGYNPDAVVWNAACVSNSLWPNHQRIKQYSGDHTETWGGSALTVDSNVFDSGVIGTGMAEAGERGPVSFVQDFGPLGGSSGWLLRGGRLFLTDDAGAAWIEISPPDFELLGASFFDRTTGWVVGWPQGEPALVAGRTTDGGATWQFSDFPAPGLVRGAVAAAYPGSLDGDQAWIALKLQSGSSFSLGRLFASADGGETWDLRTLPLGEPVAFENPLEGWTQGGPGGGSAYRTSDGGRTWTVADQGGPGPQSPVTGSLPSIPVLTRGRDGQVFWALTQRGSCSGPKTEPLCSSSERLWLTVDGGSTWVEIPAPIDGEE